MIGLLLALMVGVLFATGAYLLLRRDSIKLILGLGLLSYGINLLLFGSGMLKRGQPPIVADKATFSGDISHFVDPLPQALILTAIVISFGVSAFMVVLLNRRNALMAEHEKQATLHPSKIAGDPFSATGHYLGGLDQDPDDYEWLEYSLMAEYRLGLSDRAPTEVEQD